MSKLSKKLNKGRLKNLQGFTLIELAIVLVIIGLIIAMAFKGNQLIDGAKVKNLAAQYNKIVAAINTFYERYGFYPGDGCENTPKPSSPLDCDGEKDGILKNANETKAFWHLLINVTGLLTRADRKVYSVRIGRSGTMAPVQIGLTFPEVSRLMQE